MSSFYSRNDFGGRSTSSDVTSDATTVPSACPACRSSSITTTSKSPQADSYWRCSACGEVWNAARRQDVRRGANAWR